MSRNQNRILTEEDSGREADIIERWIQTLTLRSTPYILIYALPGSGKTTFANKLRRKGINIIDSDDVTDERDDSTSDPVRRTALMKSGFYEHDFAWRLPLASWPSLTRLAVTNLHSIALDEVEKLGYTTVFVNLTLGAYLERASTRPDLRDLPLAKWWEDAQSVADRVNIVVPDFDLIFEEATSFISGFGSMNCPLMVEKEGASRRVVGRMLRDNTHLWLEGRGRKSHFIGSEIETLAMLAYFGTRARVSGWRDAEPAAFPRMFEVEGEADYRESEGQRKLAAMDFPFTTANITNVIAVGGSPGSHFYQTMFGGNKRLIIVDPREPDSLILNSTSMNAKWISSELNDIEELAAYMSEPFVFLSDIRSDGFTEADVAMNNALQMRWFSALMGKFSRNCRGVSLKFRPPHDSLSFQIPSNMMSVYQVHNAGQSMETRLMWRPDLGTNYRMETFSTSNYAQSVHSWNVARTQIPSLEVKQERLIATWLIENMDYVGNSRFLNREETLVGFYTVSNSKPKDVVLQLLRRWNDLGIEFVINLPFESVFRLLDSGGDAVALTGAGGNDTTFVPSDLIGTGLHCFSIADWVSLMRLGWNRKSTPHIRKPRPCCSGSPYMREWFIVTNAIPKGEEMQFQTALSSQTWCVKYITAFLRDVWGHTNSTLHTVRREVVEAWGGEGIDDPRVNGKINVNGNDVYVSVSGHMVNLLIAANIHVIDFDRWIETVRMNLYSYYTKRGASVWRRLWKKRVLAEDGQKYSYPRLYHGYYDFKLATTVVEKMSARFGFRIDNRVLTYLGEAFDKLVISYPAWRYSISSDAANYVNSGT